MYTLATAIISVVFCYRIFRLLYQAEHAQGVRMSELPGLVLGWACLSFAALLPIGIAYFDATANRSMTPWVVISGVAGFVLAACALGSMWRDYRHSRKVSFLDVGANIVLVAAGLLVCVAGYKHVQFASDEAGWANIEALHELNYAGDLACAGGVVIVNWPAEDSNVPARYRCPTGFAFGTHAQLPFVPWPDYQEGESLELAKALAELKSRATP